MFEYFLTVVQQIFSMALMVLVGYAIYKAKMISEEGLKSMSNLLMKIVTPMILISSFQRQFSGDLMLDWTAMFVVAVLTYGVQMLLAWIFYRNPKSHAFAENRMSIVMPNNGFLAFPLMQALAGENGIFLGSTNVIILNILLWTYGVKHLKSDEKINIKKILLNPGVIAVVLGLLLFVSPVKLPKPVFNAIDAIGALNTPLAMIILGGLLAQTDLKKCLSQFGFYKISFIKLILLPIIMMFIFKLLPISGNVMLVSFICSVTPVATAVGMLSQLYDGDYRYATGSIIITTVLSAITMPIILAIGSGILGY